MNAAETKTPLPRWKGGVKEMLAFEEIVQAKSPTRVDDALKALESHRSHHLRTPRILSLPSLCPS